ncbi:MAG TPA: type IV toxin-antitoxin system AbiEi family antitoxin domain-containing protein [Solirubrobacterales bacterium]
MRDKTRTHHAVAELAAAQHGVVSGRQLGELGFSRATASREATAGRLHRIHRGVYAVGHPTLSPHGRCLAAVLACGEGALLSHSSAAWLWGLTPHCYRIVDVTARAGKHARPTIRTHSTKALESVDRATAEQIPVTAVPHTLLDLAATSRHRSLGRALARAERLGLLDLMALEDLLRRNTGRQGVSRLRRALVIYRVPAFTRSGLERRFMEVARRAGLPRPSMNLFVAGYELDAYWPRERFAVELDSYEYHGGHASFERDRVRQEDLKLAGIEMTRITAGRIEREPTAVTQRLRQLLAQRRQELGIATR